MDNKPIVVYGAGIRGKLAKKIYGDRVRCFCDGDRRKVGTCIDGTPIISPEDLVKIHSEVNIVVSSLYYGPEIVHGLRENGVCEDVYFVDIQEGEYVNDIYSFRELFSLDRVASSIRGERKAENIGSFCNQNWGKDKQKKKAVFFISLQIEWNLVSSLYEEMKEYDRLVVVKRNDRYGDYLYGLKDAGIPCVYDTKCSFEEILPDVAIYTISMPYGKGFSVHEMNDKGVLTVGIPLDAINNYPNSIEDLYSNGWHMFETHLSIVTPNLRDFVVNRKENSNGCYSFGNPKFDLVYKRLNCEINNRYHVWLKKTTGKRVILWAPTHGVGKTYVSGIFSVDVFFFDLIRFIESNKNDYLLIFRPHPIFFDEMLSSGTWNYGECKMFERLFDENDNLILDTTEDYGVAYKISDLLISDASGTLLSYLPTGKPIIHTHPNRGVEFGEKELVKNYYQADNGVDLIRIIQDIDRKGDYLHERRMNAMKSYIPYFDGKIGFRVKELIDKSLLII